MKKQCSEGSQGDIKGFSRALYKILGVVAILYPIIIVTNILSEIWRIFGRTVDVITMGVFDILLLRFEDSSIFIPATSWGITIYGDSPVREPVVFEIALIAGLLLIAHCLIYVGVFYLKAIFKELKSGMSPFNEKMVGRILSLAWIATFLTIGEVLSNQHVSLINVVLLVITWLLYYVFEYGRKLQDESDTTL